MRKWISGLRSRLPSLAIQDLRLPIGLQVLHLSPCHWDHLSGMLGKSRKAQVEETKRAAMLFLFFSRLLPMGF